MPRYSIGFSSNLRPIVEPHQASSTTVEKVSPECVWKTVYSSVVPYSVYSHEILNLRFKSEATKVAKYDISDAKKLGQDEIARVQYLQFDLKTIKIATNNFSSSRKIGQGGYGVVYKGVLPCGKQIAVKRRSSEGEIEFKNEVVLLAKLQHSNLVWLQGFCMKSEERLLIYEFAPNGSLDGYLFDPVKKGYLDWERRYKIIRGIARGLLYLHEDSRVRILHRDLKPSNILLDEQMNAKIADFGMALLCPMDQKQVTTDRVVGTYGYMAPEYYMRGECSVKSDIYSFGAVVLTIVSGGKVSSFSFDGVDLLSYAWKNWREGTPLNIVDPTLRTASSEELTRCIHIALLCIQVNPVDRPSTGYVACMLNTNSYSLSLPSLPVCEYEPWGTESIPGEYESRVIESIPGEYESRVIESISGAEWSIKGSSTSSVLEPR